MVAGFPWKIGVQMIEFAGKYGQVATVTIV